MRHDKPASVLKNVSDSSYGTRWGPIDPTPTTKPGAGDENMRPKLCGFVTEWKWSEQLSRSEVEHGALFPSTSKSGARSGAQELPERTGQLVSAMQ